MRRRKSRRSKKLLALGGLFVVALIAGISAYFYQEVFLNNPFSTQQYGGAMVETFTPENDWEPGMQVTKDVAIENTGDYDLFVRVFMDEVWENATGPFYTLDSATPLFNMNTYTDELVSGGTVVYKELNVAETDDWTWFPDDGYFYYEYILEPGDTTQSLLESLTLAAKASMGTYIETVYYKLTDDIDWTEVTLTNPLPATYAMIKSQSVLTPDTGYANADYTLTIKTQLIQANAAAAVNELSPAWAVTIPTLPTP